jgi:cell wall-associated NlpC family hydrolase
MMTALGMAEATPSSALTPTQIETKAYSIAKSKNGYPYQYGAAGPYRFDCSGLTYYAFGHAGHAVPRTAQSQYNSMHHISWSYRRVGDLVAIGYSSSRITHVGIYAGYWSGKSWMINANSGSYRGYRVVYAPISEYLGGGRHAYYGRLW